MRILNVLFPSRKRHLFNLDSFHPARSGLRAPTVRVSSSQNCSHSSRATQCLFLGHVVLAHRLTRPINTSAIHPCMATLAPCYSGSVVQSDLEGLRENDSLDISRRRTIYRREPQNAQTICQRCDHCCVRNCTANLDRSDGHLIALPAMQVYDPRTYLYRLAWKAWQAAAACSAIRPHPEHCLGSRGHWISRCRGSRCSRACHKRSASNVNIISRSGAFRRRQT